MKSIPYSRGHSTHCGCPITSSQLPNSTTRALLPSPLAEDKTEVQKGEVTFPGSRASAGGKPRSERREQCCGNTRSAEVPPLHAAGSPHPPGRGVRKSPSGRRGLPSPGPRRAGVQRLKGPGDLGRALPAPSGPWAQGRSGRSGPGASGSAECAPGPGGSGPGGRLGEGAPGAATRHSRVELVVHPLAAAVATASQSDFRSARSCRQRPGYFRLARRSAERRRAGPAPGRFPRRASQEGCAT